MVAEPLWHKHEREARQAGQFPELDIAGDEDLFAVDRMRRAEGRPLTSLGTAVETAYLDGKLRAAQGEYGWASDSEADSASRGYVDAYAQSDTSPDAAPRGDYGGPSASAFLPYPSTPPPQAPSFWGQVGTNALKTAFPLAAVPDALSTIRQGAGWLEEHGISMRGPAPVAPEDSYAARAGVEDADLLRALSEMQSRPQDFMFGPNVAIGALDDVGRVVGGVSAATRRATQAGLGQTTDDLIGLRAIEPGLTRPQRISNLIKETLGLGVPAHELATPAMAERSRVQPIIEAQSKRLGALAEKVAGLFELDDMGRVTALAGGADMPLGPTLADVAADRGWWPRLSQAQREGLEKLRVELEPWRDLLTQHGIEPRTRADVQRGGGYYLPRGVATLGDADAPLRVSANTSVGGRAGFEKAAQFPSQAAATLEGFSYPSLAEAVSSYVSDAGKRVADVSTVNFFKSLRDEDGRLLGRTPKSRLLDVNPSLAHDMDALRKGLGRLRSLKVSLSDRTELAISRWLEDGEYDDLDDLRDALTPKVAWGTYEGATRPEVSAAISDVQDLITEIRPAYRAALEKARQTPRDENLIGFTALTGRSFPTELANAANKVLRAEGPPTGRNTSLLRAAEGVNQLARGLRATGDLSGLGVQGIVGLASDPKAYGTATKAMVQSLFDRATTGKFVESFDETARMRGTINSREWVKAGLHIGGADSEFALGQGLGRFTGAVSNLPVVRHTNRAFGAFGDALRLELADTMREVMEARGKSINEPDVMEDIARVANNMTGWSTSRVGESAGDLLFFAPRFWASQLELVAGTIDTGVRGQLARRALLRLAGAATVASAGANAALLESGEGGTPWDDFWSVDGSNFLRVRFKGNDYSMLGPWDSLVRGMVHLANGDPGYVARSKASSIVSTAWDQLTGEDFIGRPVRDTKAHFAEWLARQLTPISGEAALGAAQTLGDGDLLGGGLEAAAAVAGVKSSPVTPTEQLDDLARAQYGKAFFDLEPLEQDELERANPSLAAERLARGSEQRQVRIQAQAQTREKQLRLDDALLKGGLTVDRWNEQSRLLDANLDGQLVNLYRDLPDDASDERPHIQYARELDRLDKEYGGLWSPEARQAIDLFRASHDEAWNDYVDRNTGRNGTPLQADRRRVVRDMRRAGGFDLGDEAWKSVQAQSAFTKDTSAFKTYGEWYGATFSQVYGQLLEAGVPEVRAVTEATNAVEKHPAYKPYHALRGQLTKEWVVAHPELAIDAAAWDLLPLVKETRRILEAYQSSYNDRSSLQEARDRAR